MNLYRNKQQFFTSFFPKHQSFKEMNLVFFQYFFFFADQVFNVKIPGFSDHFLKGAFFVGFGGI